MWPHQVSKVDIPTLVFPPPKFAFLKVLCVEVHRYGTEFSCLDKDLPPFHVRSAITFQNLKVVGCLLWRNKFVMVNSFDVKESDQHSFDLQF